MQGNIISKANESLIQEYLDIAANDSENLDRTMRLMSDDCVWVMETTGDEFRSRKEIEAFVSTAMSGRAHQGQYRIQISNWFTDGEHLCIEYTHGAVLTGVYSAGIKAKIKQGTLRYCITFHMQGGKFDWVHEYIQGTTFLANLVMPLALKRLRRLVDIKLSGQNRPIGIMIIAAFMILAGIAEVVTGFRHNFFGITTSNVNIFTYSSVVIGIFYTAAGLLILAMKKWAAVLAIVLLILDIIGRIALVLAGLYPLDSIKNTFAIIAGTLIVALIVIYIGGKWKSYR